MGLTHYLPWATILESIGLGVPSVHSMPAKAVKNGMGLLSGEAYSDGAVHRASCSLILAADGSFISCLIFNEASARRMAWARSPIRSRARLRFQSVAASP